MLKIFGYFLFFIYTSVFADTNVNTYIPVNATKYLPILKQEQVTYWGNHPNPAQLASLVEHESCVSLTNSRCWSPTSQLKTQREEGAGLGQITRAYDKSGNLRFDALAELKQIHPELSMLTWNNVYQKPEYQLRAIILKSNDNFRSLNMVNDFNERLKFSDSAYNGGLGGVQNERRACQLKTGCNPQVWKNNVENTCLKSKQALYGTRSACDINRFHVIDVTETRVHKYEQYMNTQVKIQEKQIIVSDQKNNKDSKIIIDKPIMIKKSILNIISDSVFSYFK